MRRLLFFTNSNPDLAKVVAQKGKLRIGRVKIGRFVDGEVLVRIEEPVKNEEVFVLGSSFPSAENLLELLILIDTLKINGAKKITAIIPYFGYSRSDHIYRPGASLSARLMADFIQTAGADEVIAIDLHSNKVEYFFTTKIRHLRAADLLADEFRKLKVKNLIVVAPDLGARKKAKDLAEILKTRAVIITKRRLKYEKAKAMQITGEVKGRNVLLVDDMIQSGGTVIEAVKLLKRKGANDIYVAVTHLVYSANPVARLNKMPAIKKVLATDTIPPPKKLPRKFKIISVAKVVAQSIKRS